MLSGSNDDDRDDPVVGVDLDDAERLYEERLRFLITAREPGSHEDEALPPGRHDGRRKIRDPEIGDRPHI